MGSSITQHHDEYIFHMHRHDQCKETDNVRCISNLTLSRPRPPSLPSSWRTAVVLLSAIIGVSE